MSETTSPPSTIPFQMALSYPYAPRNGPAPPSNRPWIMQIWEARAGASHVLMALILEQSGARATGNTVLLRQMPGLRLPASKGKP
jgi:hypothetical protein